jgi:hypothetical protein
MKKLLFILVGVVFLIGCTQVKEHQMEKDAEKVIELSKNATLFNMVEFSVYEKSLMDKYKGDDYLKFMQILKKKVLEKKSKGEDCGIIELIYLFDNDFRDQEYTSPSIKKEHEADKDNIEVSAYLVYDDGSISDFDVLNEDVVLWNTIIGEGDAEKPSNKVKIIVSGKGNNLRINIMNGEEIVIDKDISISNKTEFIISDTGCEQVTINIKNKNIDYRDNIDFQCGE